METAKQKAIREAYGEHWDKVKDMVKENGCLNLIEARRFIPNRNTDVFERIMKDYADSSYRPKSLQGIETNNGWITIESEADLPKDIVDCFVIKDRILHYPLLFKPYLKQFVSIDDSCYDWNEISHWQPIKEPLKPIY